MFSSYTKLRTLFTTMYVAGIILAPIVIATPAIQDLAVLRTVIDATAATIADLKNPNLGWGFRSGGGMGTADLVNNITTTVLRMKYEMDTNKTAWLTPENITDPTTNLTAPSPSTPTLPLTASIVLPSTAPTATPTSAANTTTDLSAPYTDYVAAMPNLSTALQTLGRAYHREMNTPVSEAIEALQQAMTTLQSACLAFNLIGAPSVLRTLRASSSLENAQSAWGRPLNLPGRGPSTDSGSADISTGGLNKREIDQSGEAMAERPRPSDGRYYTHQELWGRSASGSRTLKDGKGSRKEAIIQDYQRRVILAEEAKVGRPFVG